MVWKQDINREDPGSNLLFVHEAFCIILGQILKKRGGTMYTTLSLLEEEWYKNIK